MKIGFEREKRFVVISMDNTAIIKAKNSQFQQGYFDLGELAKSFRVRIEDKKRAEVVFKEGSGFLRKEKPMVTEDLALANFLLEESSHRFKKIRYFPEWHDENSLLTIDIYERPLAGLVIAEIEFKISGKLVTSFSIQKPSWIHEWIDITDSISNLHLARMATELRVSKKNKPPISFYDKILSKRIPRIVLTGPPCSGKSAMMKIILREMGSEVHCMQEVATILISQVGVKPDTNPYRFNTEVYRIQGIFEATSEGQAIDERKKALIIDRGCVDIVAYMKNGWRDFTRTFKTEKEYELNRYQLVIYLDIPPKNIYEQTKKNNEARTENYEKAFLLGNRLKEAWKDHPNFYFVSSYDSWEEKEDTVMYIIKRFLSE